MGAVLPLSTWELCFPCPHGSCASPCPHGSYACPVHMGAVLPLPIWELCFSCPHGSCASPVHMGAMCIVCDNPRASQLVNHLGSTALLHCSICTVSLKQDLLISFYAFYFQCYKGQAKTQPRNHLCTQNKICNAATYDGHQITAN